jgi:hypothetical protein
LVPKRATVNEQVIRRRELDTRKSGRADLGSPRLFRGFGVVIAEDSVKSPIMAAICALTIC